MSERKHGGCKDCGSTDQEILVSILRAGESVALCDTCRKGVPN